MPPPPPADPFPANPSLDDPSLADPSPADPSPADPVLPETPRAPARGSVAPAATGPAPPRAGASPTSRSISRRMRPRARCSRTRWFSALIASSAQVSAASRPSMSRSTITARWPAGNRSTTSSTWSQSWRPPTIRSGVTFSHSRGASAQWPSGVNRSSGTPRPPGRPPGAAPSSSAPRPTSRPSRDRRVRARFSTMLNSQVARLDRPSNRATPAWAAIHASCVTSSACAWLPMTAAASRTNEAWNRRTSRRHASASPARRRARKAGSSKSVGGMAGAASVLAGHHGTDRAACDPGGAGPSLAERPSLAEGRSGLCPAPHREGAALPDHPPPWIKTGPRPRTRIRGVRSSTGGRGPGARPPPWDMGRGAGQGPVFPPSNDSFRPTTEKDRIPC